jgi:hypothetical protein
VFSIYENSNSEVYTMAPDGTGLTNLTNDSVWDEGSPDWQPFNPMIPNP